MDIKKRVVISIVVLLVLVAAFYFITSTITRLTGFTITGKAVYSAERLDNLAKCMTEKGIKLYTNPTCTHCNAQKRLFKTAIQYVDVIECDYTIAKCYDLLGVPAWDINGDIFYGKKEIKELIELSGCEV